MGNVKSVGGEIFTNVIDFFTLQLSTLLLNSENDERVYHESNEKKCHKKEQIFGQPN